MLWWFFFFTKICFFVLGYSTVRLERYATETNKLIIRLHKLLTDRPSDSMQQKIHEQTVLCVCDLQIYFLKIIRKVFVTVSTLAGWLIS